MRNASRRGTSRMVAPGIERSMRALRVAMRRQRELSDTIDSQDALRRAMDLAMVDVTLGTEAAEINIAAVADARAVA